MAVCVKGKEEVKTNAPEGVKIESIKFNSPNLYLGTLLSNFFSGILLAPYLWHSAWRSRMGNTRIMVRKR